MSKEWFELQQFDRWQRLKRHPEYREFCQKYKKYFDETGIAAMGFLDHENGMALSSIKERFNLATVYHCDCVFTSSELLAYSDIFKDSLTVHPKSRLKDGNISIINDDNYIDCRINIDPAIPLEEIKNQVAFFVKYARHEISSKDIRQQFDSNSKAYEIYDQRIARIPFLQISRKLGIKEESARQKYRRAYELIHNEKYNPSKSAELTEQYFVEQETWDRMEEIEKAPREQTLSYNNLYKLQNLTYDRQEDLTETIQSIKKECDKCDDKDCSTKMVSHFDKWLLDIDSDYNFSKVDPCPELHEMIYNMIRWQHH